MWLNLRYLVNKRLSNEVAMSLEALICNLVGRLRLSIVIILVDLGCVSGFVLMFSLLLLS